MVFPTQLRLRSAGAGRDAQRLTRPPPRRASSVSRRAPGLGTRQAVTTFDYGLKTGTGVWAGGYQGGVVTHQRTVTQTLTVANTTVASDTETLYQWWDGARVRMVVHKPNAAQATQYDTRHDHDANGHVVFADVDDGRERNVVYVTDSAGQVMSRTETATWDGAPTGPNANPRDQYFYFNGMRVGEVSNNGPSDADYATTIAARNDPAPAAYSPFRNGVLQNYADFDQSYDAITASSTRATGTRITVQDGDTLSSIAAAAWGDASLWYRIADANGLNGSETLVAGQTLTIPAKITNVHNTSDTFRVYDPNKALGDTSPTQAKPVAPQGKKGCGIIGQILVVAIAVAVTVLTKGLLAKPMAALVGSVMGTGAAATIVTAVATGAIAGAAGSIVSQGFAVATGIQDKFSWKSVGISAISAGIADGLGSAGPLSRLGGLTGDIARGTAANVLTQGVAVATGLQDKFDWTGVAAAAVMAGVGSKVGGSRFVQGLSSETARVGVTALARGVAGAGTRSLIDGTSFGDNLMAVLPDVIGQTIGNMVAGGIAAKQEAARKPGGVSLTVAEGGEDDHIATFANGREVPYAVADQPQQLTGIKGLIPSQDLWPTLDDVDLRDATGVGLAQDAQGEKWVQFQFGDEKVYQLRGSFWPGFWETASAPIEVLNSASVASIDELRSVGALPELAASTPSNGFNSPFGLSSVMNIDWSATPSNTQISSAPAVQFEWGHQAMNAFRLRQMQGRESIANQPYNRFPWTVLNPEMGLHNLSELYVKPAWRATTQFTLGGIIKDDPSTAGIVAETNRQHPFILDPNHVPTAIERQDFAINVLALVAARRVAGQTTAAESAAPIAFGTPYRQLSRTGRATLLEKIQSRTITRDEWNRLQWNERLTARRQDGLDSFWALERQNLTHGLPGSRNWSPEAQDAILSGGTPRGIFGHHKYSVSQYPQLANSPSNIAPVTFNEHLYRWHGGNWRNPTHGVPLRPDIPPQF